MGNLLYQKITQRKLSLSYDSRTQQSYWNAFITIFNLFHHFHYINFLKSYSGAHFKLLYKVI